MMKRGFRLILVCLLFASIFSISFVSASILGSWFTGNAVAATCTDSDGGIKNLVKGTASGIDAKTNAQVSSTDSCANSKTLIEYFCDANGKVTSTFASCSLGCSNGACKQSGTTPSTGTTTPGTGTATQKTCSQTRTFTRQTTNLCAAGETIGNKKSYRQCAWFNPFRRTCMTYYDYTCTKITKTKCSATAACPAGTREIELVGCSLLPSGISPNAYIIEDPGNLNFGNKIELMQKLGNKFYQTYPQDNYDFIAFYFKDGPSDFVLSGGSFMHQFPAQQGSFTSSPAGGSGISDSFKPIALGSTGRLKATYEISSDFKEIYVKRIYGSVFVDYIYFAEDVHELTHWWGVFLPNELQEATVYDPATNTYTQAHWEFLIGSWIAKQPSPNYEFIEENGRYYFKTSCTSEPKQHDFDLYSMGLINASNVIDKLVLNGKRGQIPGTGFIRCDTLTEVSVDWIRKVFTIQDMISVLGPRIPSSADAQKDFNMAFVMVVPKGQILTSEENAALNWLANKFPIVWYKTTKGKSTLNNIIPKDLTPPIISNVQSDMVHAAGFGDLKTINVTFDTNEPTMSYLLYTDHTESKMYPTILKNPPEFSTHYNIKPPVLNTGTEYNVKIISIDENYNMASYNIGTIRTNP